MERWIRTFARFGVTSVVVSGCFSNSGPADAGDPTAGQGSDSTPGTESNTPVETSRGTTSSTTDPGNGLPCSVDADCGSGHCIDRICCDTACEGACESCDLPGTKGTCTPVPKGEDPKAACPAGTGEAAACKPGTCDGEGSCTLAEKGTVCRAGSCDKGTQVDVAYCDPTGECPAETTTACAPYTCGADACNTACGAPDACGTDRYCDVDSKQCLPQKKPGIGCSVTDECQTGNTCLDGVCCAQSSCPSCTNCGAGGECTIKVTDSEDLTGSTCEGDSVCSASGACLADLGQPCADATTCASGHCVDGVCCGEAACPSCRNCGATGSCDVVVASADDVSDVACSGANTCGTQGTCVARWELVGSFASDKPAWGAYSTTVGDTLYFASGNGHPEWFKAFKTSTNTLSDATQTNWDYCYCGYTGVSVSNGTSIYYFGNGTGNDGNGERLTPGDAQWATLTSYDGANVSDGENATAYLAGKIYRIGGRSYARRTSAYDITGNTWNLGLAQAPATGVNRCAGASGSDVFLFEGPRGAVHVYSTTANGWTSLASDPNQPYCYQQELHLWQGSLVAAANDGVHRFRTGTRTWDAAAIPLPEGSLDFPRAMVANGTMYLVAHNGAAGQVKIWKYLLPP